LSLETLLKRQVILKRFAGNNFIFDVDGDIVRTEVKINKIELKDFEGRLSDSSNVKININSKNFMNLIFNGVNPYLLYLKCGISISGLNNILTVL
jgi:hypothetical protein